MYRNSATTNSTRDLNPVARRGLTAHRELNPLTPATLPSILGVLAKTPATGQPAVHVWHMPFKRSCHAYLCMACTGTAECACMICISLALRSVTAGKACMQSLHITESHMYKCMTEHTDALLLLGLGVVHLVPLAALDHLPEDIQATNQLAIQDDLREGYTRTSASFDSSLLK